MFFDGEDLKILTRKLVRSYGTDNDEYLIVTVQDYQEYFNSLGYKFRVTEYFNRGIKVTGRTSEIVLFKLKS